MKIRDCACRIGCLADMIRNGVCYPVFDDARCS